MTVNELSPEAEKAYRIFRKCLPMQLRLQEVARCLGDTEGQTCLDVGTDNGVLSHHLRRRGGTWHTVVKGEKTADAMRAVVKENVQVMDGKALPFKKKVFDVVVVVSLLEEMADDRAFIEECHRVLRPDGRLIVNVAHNKSWTLMKPLRRLLGQTHEERGRARPGYSESELFHILKHGFDVHNMRSYSRFFLEFTHALVEWLAGRMARMRAAEDRRRRLFSVAGPFYRLADQLDLLLFFTRGFNLIASAKRRAWLPRKTPVLVDGRSISEAVLSKAAD